MNYTKVESSNIDGIGYENGTLFVKFKNNSEYKYAGVPAELYEQLKKAESKGKFINESVKGRFNFEKVNTKTVLNESK